MRKDNISWEYNVSHARQFFACFGKDADPVEMNNDINLDAFLKNQIMLDRAGALDPEKKAQLEEIGVNFSSNDKKSYKTHDERWDEMLLQAREYIVEHGNYFSPQEKEEHARLNRFYRKVRYYVRHYQLPPERYAELLEINFRFSRQRENDTLEDYTALYNQENEQADTSFYEKLTEAKAWMAAYGPWVIPPREGPFIALSDWYRNIRNAYNNNRLKKVQLGQLLAIHFPFEACISLARFKSILAHLQSLKMYEANTGHPVVSSADRKKHKTIYEFIRRARKRRRAEGDQGIYAQIIGYYYPHFPWESRYSAQDKQRLAEAVWQSRLEQLAEYLAEAKPVSGLSAYKDDPSLHVWLQNQLSRRENGELDDNNNLLLDQVLQSEISNNPNKDNSNDRDENNQLAA
jgi:hypothetical protein